MKRTSLLTSVCGLLLLAASAIGCAEPRTTCQCCDGTTVQITVCEDCRPIVAPCESACSARGGAVPTRCADAATSRDVPDARAD